MILFWILFFSILLYIYYVLLINARLAPVAPAGALSPAGADAPGAAAPDSEADADPEYLDMNALESPALPSVPSIPAQRDADGVYRGGAAGPHPNVFASGPFDLSAPALLKGDRRQGQRRERLRRAEDQPGGVPHREPDDRRLAPRRVWLRRQEDHEHLELVDEEEAARILSATPDTIEKWILSADLPFHMVTKGAMREKRFDRVELLGWLGAEDVMEARARVQREETE